MTHLDDYEDTKGSAASLMRAKMKPDLLGMEIPSDERIGIPPNECEFDDEETLTFLTRIAEGWGEYEAGMAAPLSWSPGQIQRFLKNPERSELIWALRERENESVERAIRRTAEAGNPTAQKLWAFNKMAHRGWADRRNVKIEGHANIELVASVREALNEQTRALVLEAGTDGIAALQQSIGLGDDPDGQDDIVEAELVER